MGFGKWIGGIVGFMAAGPLGALAGYAIGSMLENMTKAIIAVVDIHTIIQLMANAIASFSPCW